MLRQVLLFTRDVHTSLRFFGVNGLGLEVVHENDKFAELICQRTANNLQNNNHVNIPSIGLQYVEREAECSTGYSPFLQFDVDNMDIVIQRLLMNHGRLDGSIKFPVEGRVASVRSPCGHMIGLFEPNPEIRDLP